jgi:hypothetical protein
MRIIQKYECELCKAVFDAEVDAKKCEEKHPKDIEIVDVIFDEHKAMPTEIILKWSKQQGIKCRSAKYKMDSFIAN